MENISREEVIQIAQEYLGYPSCKYEPDTELLGSNEQGFTCSGFVKFVLQKAGVAVPKNIRHTREFFDYFGVSVHADKVLPGDLVFFTRYGTYPNHMGIVLSENKYIFSAGMKKGEVKIGPIQNSYKNNIDNSDKKVIYTSNPIGYKRIALPMGNYQEILE